MPLFAIMRWSKVTNAKQAAAATGHNYRKYEVPNTEKTPLYPNKEFINLDGRNYWELAEERIKEAEVRRVRSDSVKAMEVILTGSPEAFTRDEQGRALDYSDSKWVKDNLAFLQDKFEAKNVLSFTLHQDEKTPHIHAVITPITSDGRLSADQLFNPITLRQYQSDYAEAMKAHGMERGVDHSQAVHQPMKQFYGQQAQTASQVAEQVGPVEVQPIRIEAPTFKQKLNLDKYAADLEKQVNAELSRQVKAAIQRAQPAVNLAVENASAKEKVQALQQQLQTSEKLKEKKIAELTQVKTELTQVKKDLLTKTDQVTQFEQTQRQHAVMAAEGRLPVSLVEQGKSVRQQAYREVGKVLVGAAQKGAVYELNLPGYVTYPGQLVHTAAGWPAQGKPDYGFEEEYWRRVKEQGCEKVRIGERDYLTHLATGARFPLEKVQAGGQPVLELVAARKSQHEELFAKLAQEQADSRERDRLKVEGLATKWLAQETLYDLKILVAYAGHAGITVTSPQPGQLRLRLEATGQEFADTELKPNGKLFGEQFWQISKVNMAKFTREYEAERASVKQISM